MESLIFLLLVVVLVVLLLPRRSKGESVTISVLDPPLEKDALIEVTLGDGTTYYMWTDIDGNFKYETKTKGEL